jgi:hypothetical protein
MDYSDFDGTEIRVETKLITLLCGGGQGYQWHYLFRFGGAWMNLHNRRCYFVMAGQAIRRTEIAQLWYLLASCCVLHGRRIA